jgi:hypothetical protein
MSIEAIYDVFGQKCENVFYVTHFAGITPELMASDGAAFVDWYDAHGKATMHSGVTLSKLVIKDLTSQNGHAIEYNTGLPLSGADSTHQAAPLNVTAAVSFGTGLRGRSFRGRIYQVGMTVYQLIDNQLTSGMRSALIEVYGELVTAMQTNAGRLCVVSRYHDKTARTTGVATPITSVNVNIDIDSQRRRLTGRGK